MPEVKTTRDQMGREVIFSFPPKRIVSLVPSQTELLYDLGLDAEIVGQTLFCIHPHNQWQKKTRIGGTKKLNLERIAELNPDLIIGNKEENEQEQVQALMNKFPVWMSDVQSLDNALDMIEKVGELVNKKNEAFVLSGKIRTNFQQLSTHRLTITTSPITGYFIWRDPFMAAGHHTFINDMLKYCGFKNVFENKDSRYPEISNEELIKVNPELVLLSSEPYPFKEKHIAEIKEILPDATILLVNGELFSWYGSRLLKSAKYFEELINSIEHE